MSAMRLAVNLKNHVLSLLRGTWQKVTSATPFLNLEEGQRYFRGMNFRVVFALMSAWVAMVGWGQETIPPSGHPDGHHQWSLRPSFGRSKERLIKVTHSCSRGGNTFRRALESKLSLLLTKKAAHNVNGFCSRGGRIRTCDLLVPNQAP